MNTHELSPPARLLLRLGLALWVVAILASAWELLALQPPDSPLHVGVLAGPIAQLSTFAFAHGAAAWLLALGWTRLVEDGRWLAWSFTCGSLLHVGALVYAAARGLLAVQLLDPRADARFAVYMRVLGQLVTTCTLLALCWRALRPQRASNAPL
jgi:hypothetical protein